MIGNQEVLSPYIREMLEAQGKSALVAAEELAHADKSTEGGQTPTVEPTTYIVGTGEATTGYVFTTQPEAFVPELVGGTSSITSVNITPTKPRRAAVNVTSVYGHNLELLQTVITWAPPLTDSTGRWLETITNNVTGITYRDAISYYLVERENLSTGEIVTIAIVAHSSQAVYSIREYLTAQKTAGELGCVTDPYTWIPTFDSALYQAVTDINGDPVTVDGVALTELVVPTDGEVYFSCEDTSAISGQTYRYTVKAITSNNQEGVSVSIIPGVVAVAGGTTLAFLNSWCASYPVTGAGDSSASGVSYADISVEAGALVTEVDLSVIAIQDSVLIVDTTSTVSDTDPRIIETREVAPVLYAPDTGTLEQIIEFVGINFESYGGITAISDGSGVSLVSITKTVISDSTTQYRYKARLSVASTAQVGIRTLTLTCSTGSKTAKCSRIKVKSLPTYTATEGPTINDSGDTFRFVSGSTQIFSVVGVNLDRLTGFTSTLGTLTVTAQAFNYAEISITSFTGLSTITAILGTGFTTTGKDSFYAMMSSLATSSDPTAFRGVTDSSREFPTIRMV